MITSFIIHHLVWQAWQRVLDAIARGAALSASEASTFVNTCRLPVTNPANFLEALRQEREGRGTHYKRAPLSSKLRLLCEAVNQSLTKGTPR